MGAMTDKEKELAQALLKYGRHRPLCHAYWYQGVRPAREADEHCTCGLAELRRACRKLLGHKTLVAAVAAGKESGK